MKILRQKEFGLFDTLRTLADKANKKIDPNYKTEEERRKEWTTNYNNKLEAEKRELIKKFANLSRQHKILLEISSNTSQFFPEWGDGDEYPTLSLNDTKYDIENNTFGNISFGYQSQSERVFIWKGSYWVDESSDKRINNLKSELIKDLNSYINEWKHITYLDEDEINEVLNYLENLLKEIKRSSL